MKKYIVSNPDIMGGMPIIAGTRVPIARILSLLKEGYTIGEINDLYPWVGLHKLEAVLDELANKLASAKDDQAILQA